MSDARNEMASERQMLREAAAAFCRDRLDIGRLRALQGAGSDFDTSAWLEMAQMGWAGLWIPEAHGGLGLGLADAAVVAEELGRVVAPEPFIETAVGAVAVLVRATPSAVAASALRDIAAGQRIVSVAWPQDVDAAGVDATHLDGRYLLNGSCRNVLLARSADAYIVAARLDDDVGLFWVVRDTPGVSVAVHTLSDGTSTGLLSMDGATLHATSLLARGGVAAGAIVHARHAAYLIAAAYLLGVIQQTLEMTLAYLRLRRQFGRAIGSFQALQHRAVNLFIQQEITRAVVNEAAATFDGDEGHTSAGRAVRAKHRATEAALLVVREAVQFHGAIGFTLECDVSLFLNRTLVMAAHYGNVAGLRREFAHTVASEPAEDSIEGTGKSVTEPQDGDWNRVTNQEFRLLVRRFIEAHYPPAWRFPSRKLRWSEIRDWFWILSRKGWLAPNWPREYGGMGLDAAKQIVFMEEQERWGVARTPAELGLTMVGPLLIHHGTDAQRRRYLPRILSGEHRWCQGYSEPNAGSDLASLRTEAVHDGDFFVVNGQKTWTTMALDATHIFMLVRTDKTVKPQAGISFLLADLATPGISVRPIRNLAGNEEFCEIFISDARVPAENLVGQLNGGWRVAKSLLTFERLFLGSPKQSQQALRRLEVLAAARGLFGSAAFLDRFTQLRLDVCDLESAFVRFAEQAKAGQPLGPDISILKIWATETCARLCELMLEAAGTDGATVGALDDGGVDVLSYYYYSRPPTIFGGTNEIQRNILAKEVLALPSETAATA